jgi:hypothetical protein
VQHLGAPINEGWFVSGSINVSAGSGDADLSVPISCPKGKGTVYVKAQKTAGRWDYSLMQATIEGSGERIDLLPGALAAEPQSNTPSPSPQAADVQSQTAQSNASVAPAAAPQPSAPAPSSSVAAGSDVIKSQNSNTPGVVGELIQCTRSEGVLNVKIRFHNTLGDTINFYVLAPSTDYDRFYFTAGTKKYSIVKDSDGTYLAPKPDYSCGMPGVCQKLVAGQSGIWWAKFVAPPANVTKLDLITPVMPPLEDIPITDK